MTLENGETYYVFVTTQGHIFGVIIVRILWVSGLVSEWIGI